MQLSSPQVKGFRHRRTQRFNRMSCLAPPSLGSLLASASASVLVGKPWPCGGFQQLSSPAGFLGVSGPIQRGLQVVQLDGQPASGPGPGWRPVAGLFLATSSREDRGSSQDQGTWMLHRQKQQIPFQEIFWLEEPSLAVGTSCREVSVLFHTE